jgi:putative SOS response-associated peptidase YedK
MTALYRCRGSASEITTLFDAEAEPGLVWRPDIWLGEKGLVVTVEDGRQRVRTMRWGLDAAAFTDPTRDRASRGTLFPRDLSASTGTLIDRSTLSRCLIVVEAFAYPSGIPGTRTRGWCGLWDLALFAWAGLFQGDAINAGFAGILTVARGPVAEVSGHMPLVLDPRDHAAWLEGTGLLSLTPLADSAFFLERVDERWATGAPME